MKTPFKLFFCFSFILFVAASCGKNKPKHLVAGKWVADEPVKYSYAAGGNNIGVGSTDLQWEILEMDFTDAEEGGANTAYFGNKALTTGYEYSNGNKNPLSFDWGVWRYLSYGKKSGNKFESYDSSMNVPEEWKKEKRVVGELFSEGGAVRFYVFSLSKKKMKVGFEHLNSIYGSDKRYYSPIMTFKREK